MSDDDDTGHHHSKIVAQVEAAGQKPIKLWVAVAALVVGVILGAWLF